MKKYLDNFDKLYEQYVQPNEEYFRENYAKNCLCSKIKYEECVLDFVPVSEHEYLIMDNESRQLCGTFTTGDFRSEPTENTVTSILIADEWDIRKIMPVIFSKKWSSIYFVLNQSAAKFASFFKLENFLAVLSPNVKFFADTAEMRQYFLADYDAYLPRKIVGVQPEKYEEIFQEIHDTRISSGIPSQNVLLSICIPSYNRGNFALRAVRTALTSKFDAEIEIVVCDNGSTENIEGYQEIEATKDSRLRYYRSPKNGGYHYNIMNCLHKASGKFALFSSDEDTIIPENLGLALDWLSNHLTDVGVCIFSGSGNKEWEISREQTFEPGIKAIIRVCNMNYITGCCFNMDHIKTLDLFRLETELSSNYYYNIYTHCALGLFLGFQFKVINSSIPMWYYEEKRAQNYDTDGEINGIVRFTLPENRSLQMLDIVMLVKDKVSEQELLELVESRLYSFYDMLSGLYKYPKFASTFLKMYSWVDICVLHYKNCLHLFKELEMEGVIQDLPAFTAKVDKITFNWLVCKRRQRLCTPEENLLPALQAQVAKYYYDKGTPFEKIDFKGIEKELNSWVKDFLDRRNNIV